MKKLLSLVRVQLNHDMNLFKIHSKKQSKFSKVILPLFFILYFVVLMGMYSYKLIRVLQPFQLEFVSLTLFSIGIVCLTFIEGIYKSSSLLFKCKDDSLLLSLPISKRRVLGVRIFKFYVFELLYNSIFLLPSMVIYAYVVHPSATYYLSSFMALFLLPIVPVILSCILGFIITFFSSKLKRKNLFQTVFSIFFIFLIFYISYQSNEWVSDIVKHASSIHEMIRKLYYPVGAYVTLITDFSLVAFFQWIGIHLLLFGGVIFLLGSVYFKTNSKFQEVIPTHQNKKVKMISHSKRGAFIKKEMSRFFTTPILVTNAGFGLVLYIIICVFAFLKTNSLLASFQIPEMNLSKEMILGRIPVIILGLMAFTSFMTSITSSMISLEGKSMNILKSLPIKPIQIIWYKVLTAWIISIPCILIGNTLLFIRFSLDIPSILFLLFGTFLLPLLTSMIGILANLKYPKMDAMNDTEVVKQSMSSLISVLAGMGLVGVSVIVIFKLVDLNLSNILILWIMMSVYTLMTIGLGFYLIKTCEKSFMNIEC